MKLLIAVLGLLVLAAWYVEFQLARRRSPPKDNLRHITGSPAWWKEPPGGANGGPPAA